MDQAAVLLQRGQTGPETQQPQRNALHRLELVLTALKPEMQEKQPTTGENATQTETVETGDGQRASQGAQTLAELKLIKLLQQEINMRTAALAQAVGPNGKPTDQQRRQYEQLAEEQNRLAELVLKMQKGE